MIVDLCKPLNEGESDTVRIILSVHEAQKMVHASSYKMVHASSYEDAYRDLNEAIASALRSDKITSSHVGLEIAACPSRHDREPSEWAIQDMATGLYYSGYGSGRVPAWGGKIERFSVFRWVVAALANHMMPETARPVPAPPLPATLTDAEIRAWWHARPYLTVHPTAEKADRVTTPLPWTVEDSRPKGAFYQGDTPENALRSAAEWIR